MRKEVYTIAEKVMADMQSVISDGEETNPIFVFLRDHPDGDNGFQTGVMPFGMFPTEDIAIIGGLAGELAKMSGAFGMVVAMEAWYILPEEREEGKSVSEHESRRESINLVLLDDTGQREFWMVPFDRDEEGKPEFGERMSGIEGGMGNAIIAFPLDPWQDKRPGSGISA